MTQAGQSEPPQAEPGRRARARPAYVPGRRLERVRQIAGEMARGAWERSERVPELSAEWCITAGAVDDIAGEAGRLLQITVHEVDKLEEFIRWRLHEIASQNEPDRVAALTTLAKQIGRMTDRHDVTVTAAPTREVVAQAIRQSLSDPEMRALVVTELAKYPDAVAQLAQAVPVLADGSEVDDG